MKRRAAETTKPKPLTTFADTEKRLAQIEEAVAAARREAAEAATQNPDGGPRRSRGRPAEPGSRRDVAQRTGISPREQLRIQRHAALVAEYPLFANVRWTRADALKAGSLLEALTPDQRADVAPRLADLDPPSALGLLQTLIKSSGGVAPMQGPPQSRIASAGGHDSATGRPDAGARIAAGTDNVSVAQLLEKANAMVLHAARRVQSPTVNGELRHAAGDIQLIRGQLQHGAPASTASVLGPCPTESAPRLLLIANALLLKATRRSLDPTLCGRLQRVAAYIDAIRVQLLPRADRDARSRS
jgi:hypothetical protein